MTLRTTRVVIGLALLVFSGLASALGLGPIQVNSAMNEPMNAEIEILSLGDLTETELQVKLASAEDFQNAGVDRSFHLVDLRFTLDLSDRTHPVVRVTSYKTIKEPYLDFIVEVRWTSGRMLREYTVLMDLPVFAQEKPGGKQVTASRSTKPSTPVEKPVVKTELVPTGRGTTVSEVPATPVSSGQKPKAASGAKVDTYTVAGGDTLWSIAERNTPQGATVQQTILAIYKRNPDAFINDNINLVRKGAVLRLPDAEEARALTHEQARSQLVSHTKAWREIASSASVSGAAATEAVDAKSSDGASSSLNKTEDGRLRLMAASEVSGDSGTGVGSGGGSGGGTDAIQLAIAQEELERTARENAELKEKVASLEEQVNAMSRLVELEDTGLRGAQLATDSEGELATETDEEESVAASEGFSFSDIVADTDPAVSSEVSESPIETDGEQEVIATTPESVSEVAEQSKVAQQSKQAATASIQKTEESLIDRVKGLLIPLIAGLLVIAGAVFMLIRRRGNADRVDFDMIEPGDALADSARKEPYLSGATGSVEAEIELDEEDLLFAEATENEDLDGRGLDLDESENVDAAGEADIYISLGNYDTAEEILTRSLEKDPDDLAAHFKLLELFVEKKDAGAFDEHVAKLQGVVDSEVMDQVNNIRLSLEAAAPAEAAEAEYIELPESDELDFDALASEVSLSDDELSGELEDSLEIPDKVELPGVDFDDVSATADSTDFDDLDIDLDLSEAELSEPDQAINGLDLDELDLDEASTDFDAEQDLSALASSTADNNDEQSDNSGFDLDLDLDVDLELDAESLEIDSSLEESLDLDVDEDLGVSEDLELGDESLSANGGSSTEASVDAGLDLDLGDDFDMLDGSDEVGTQLELAQAYVDMGDTEGAREILDYVALKGSEDQQSTAKGLLAKLG